MVLHPVNAAEVTTSAWFLSIRIILTIRIITSDNVINVIAKENQGCKKVEKKQFGFFLVEPLLHGPRGEDGVGTL